MRGLVFPRSPPLPADPGRDLHVELQESSRVMQGIRTTG